MIELPGLTRGEQRELLLSVGTHRGERPLSPLEVAQYMRRALNQGTDRGRIAKATHLSGPSMVGRFLRLLELHPVVQTMVDWGSGAARLAFTSASEIGRFVPPSEQQRIAEAITSHGMTSSEVKEVSQIVRRAEVTADEGVERVLARRPEIVRRYVSIGRLPSGLRKIFEEKSQRDRDEHFALATEGLFSEGVVADARLGPEYFVISGGEDLQEELRALPDGFENEIARALARTVNEK